MSDASSGQSSSTDQQGLNEALDVNGSSGDAQHQIRAELIRLAVSSGNARLIGNISCALTLSFFLWAQGPHAAIMIWSSGVALLATLTCIRDRRLSRGPIPTRSVVTLARQIIFTCGLGGALWGSAGIFLFPANAADLQLFLLLVLIGMAAGATLIWFPLANASPFFIIPCLAPVTIRFLLTREAIWLATAGLITIFGATLVGRSKAPHLTTFKAISDRREKESIPERLSILNKEMQEKIRERQRIEKELEESEQRYRRLFENISDFIYTHDLEGNILSINPLAAHKLGYLPEEMEGCHLTDFMTPKSKERFFDDYLQWIIGDAVLEGVSIFQTKDGSPCYLEYRNAVIGRGDEETVVYGSAHEITGRVRMERRLRYAEERYRSVVDNANEIIFRADIEGRWTFLNPAWTEITGFSCEQSFEKFHSDFVVEDDANLAVECRASPPYSISLQAERIRAKSSACQAIIAS